VFHRGAVAALAPEELQVDARLVSLVRKELVRPEKPALPTDDAYRFRHLLIRDAAYDALPKAMRIELHERFATWLEEHGADLVELDEIVGYHLEQAARYAEELGIRAPERNARAADRLTAAAKRAEARGDVAATINLARRADALVSREDPRRAALLLLVGTALDDGGRLAESLSVLGEAIDSGDPVAGARARAIRAKLQAHGYGVSHVATIAEIDRALAELEQTGDDAALAEANAAHARVFFWAGRIAEMREAASRAREHAERAGDFRTLVIASGLYMRSLEWSEVPRVEVEAVAHELLADDRFGPRFRIVALNQLARCALSRGSFAESDSLLTEAQASLRELGFSVDAAAQYQFRALLGWTRCDWDAMEAAARMSWDRLGELGEVGFRSTAGAMLAYALARLGRDGEAAEIVAASEAMTSRDDYVTELWALAVRSLLAANAGDYERAVELGGSCFEVAASRDDAMNHFIAQVLYAEALVAAGRADQAERVVADAVALSERMGAPGNAGRARAVVQPARQQ
jgi:hypothetical protein